MTRRGLSHSSLEWVETRTRAPVVGQTHVQTLWSGYGAITRLELEDGRTVVLKEVAPADETTHPRGWSGRRSHERKLRSYEVEHRFYASHVGGSGLPRVPTPIALDRSATGWRFLLEDLDAAGYAGRARSGATDIHACLTWLAGFHGHFLGQPPDGLWPTGTYWHLATRPDELAVTEDRVLKRAAAGLDRLLNTCQHQSFVHGDAKLANFCFGDTADGVAAVDFQYVGGGCGMKDVAYFFSSIWHDRECRARAPAALDFYFERLREAVPSGTDADALESEWRALYPVAWADFHRFLSGWAPSHQKIHPYTRAMTEAALRLL